MISPYVSVDSAQAWSLDNEKVKDYIKHTYCRYVCPRVMIDLRDFLNVTRLGSILAICVLYVIVYFCIAQ